MKMIAKDMPPGVVDAVRLVYDMAESYLDGSTSCSEWPKAYDALRIVALQLELDSEFPEWDCYEELPNVKVLSRKEADELMSDHVAMDFQEAILQGKSWSVLVEGVGSLHWRADLRQWQLEKEGK